MRHDQIIKLVIGYTLMGAVVFTVIVTCLSLIGWVTFAESGQQQKLFYVLIVEIIGISVGYFSGLLKFNPAEVRQQIISDADTAKKRLWELSSITSPTEPHFTEKQRRDLALSLRDWYYKDGGGMYLSITAADLFLKAKDALNDSGKDANNVREAFSLLRTQLKVDAGVYNANDAKTQIGPH
jgi:hypothetical protein